MKLLANTLLATFIAFGAVSAQQQEYEPHELRLALCDESREPTDIHSDSTLFLLLNRRTTAALVTLCREEYPAIRIDHRGNELYRRSYRIGGADVDQTTAQLLRRLGVMSLDDNLSTTFRFDETRSRYYPHHTLTGSISGRGSLGSVGYVAALKPHNGWLTTLLARARVGRDIYVEGVHGTGVDVGFDLMRMFRRGTLSIAGGMLYSERGLRAASTDEAFKLTGNRHYNPAWGFYEGKMRNSREATTLRPEVVASWSGELRPNTRYSLTANILYEDFARSAVAWFNAPTPMPDNYRYMPSFFDGEVASAVAQSWSTCDSRYTQLDWQRMMHTNALQRDRKAAYVVELRHANTLRGTAAWQLCSHLGHAVVDYGITLDSRTTRYFKSAEDLLGAEYIDNLDYMLMDDATFCRNLQNDLRNPDRVVVEGDRYGYDYSLTRHRATLYAASTWQLATMRFRLGGSLAAELSHRHGHYEKELFAGRGSYGASSRVAMTPYALFGMWDMLRGNHHIETRFELRGTSPEVEHLLLQPQYNNRLVEVPQLRHSLGAEVRYGWHHQVVNVAVAAFITAHLNDREVVRYYDDLAACYCNADVSNINRLCLGVEAAAAVRFNRRWSSTLTFTAGRYTYASDADVRLYADADNRLIADTRSHVGGLHLATPSVTLGANVAYRSFNGWYAELGVSYYALRYTSLSYVRRTERILSYATSPEERMALMAHRRLGDALNVDARLSKRFALPNGQSLWVQLSVDNMLNGKMPYSGYEQSRVRRIKAQYRTHVQPFDDKLTYAYPCTFRLSVSYRF